jgi:hypothetical protein
MDRSSDGVKPAVNSTNGDPKFAPPSVGALARLPRVRSAMLFAAFVAMCPLALNGRLRARQREVLARIPVDQATIPSPTAIRVLSLGHMEWAADVLYTSALVYYGETLQQRSKQRFLQTYARTVEEVDPAFRGAYLWGAMVSIYAPRLITRESVENANGHLRRGLARFPDDGEMLFQLGFNHLFEIKPFERNEAERRENGRLGAAYLQRAAALGYGPPWLALSAAGFLDESGEGVGAIELLRVTLLRTDDPATRARIERRIQTLAGSEADPGLQFARRVEAERRANFPYVSPPLYLFAGPPALRPGTRPTARPVSSTGD